MKKYLCKVNRTAFKTISIILSIALIFGCTCDPKKAYAGFKGEVNTKGCTPCKVITDNLMIGDVKSSLIGYAGITGETEKGSGQYVDYHAFYEIVPNDNSIYSDSISLSKELKNKTNDEELHFLNSTDSAPGIIDGIHQEVDKDQEEYLKADNLKVDKDLISNNITKVVEDVESYHDDLKWWCVFTGFFILYPVCFVKYAYLHYIFFGTLGLGEVAGEAFCIGLAMTILGAFVALVNLYYYNKEAEAVWDGIIDGVGVKNGKGFLNIGACDGHDHGVEVLYMHDDKLLGSIHRNNDKTDTSVELNDKDLGVNRMIIAAGCYKEEKSQTQVLSNVKKWEENIQNELEKSKKCKEKADNLLMNGYMSNNDIKGFKNVCSYLSTDDLSAKHEQNKLLSYCLSLKATTLLYSSENVVNEKVPSNIKDFYLNNMPTIMHIDNEFEEKVSNRPPIYPEEEMTEFAKLEEEIMNFE